MKIVYLNNSKPKAKDKAEEANQKAIEWMIMRQRRLAYKKFKSRLDALGISEEECYKRIKQAKDY